MKMAGVVRRIGAPRLSASADGRPGTQRIRVSLDAGSADRRCSLIIAPKQPVAVRPVGDSADLGLRQAVGMNWTSSFLDSECRIACAGDRATRIVAARSPCRWPGPARGGSVELLGWRICGPRSRAARIRRGCPAGERTTSALIDQHPGPVRSHVLEHALDRPSRRSAASNAHPARASGAGSRRRPAAKLVRGAPEQLLVGIRADRALEVEMVPAPRSGRTSDGGQRGPPQGLSLV